MDEMDEMDKMDVDSAALPGLGGEVAGDLGFRSAPPQAMECRPSGTVDGLDSGMRRNDGYVETGGKVKRQDDASTMDKVIVLEDLLREDEGELAETVSFSEMQKIIGIKR